MSINFKKLHYVSGWHEEEILKSNLCGCFNCLSIFPSSEIIEWVEERENCPRGKGKTAICPKCHIDTVLPDTTEYELTESLLKKMQKEYCE